jgi:hypothetical protein
VPGSSISEHLVQALQTTLAEVEASSGVSSDDPALAALKSIVLRRIADVELAKAEAGLSSEPAATIPPTGSIAALPVAGEKLVGTQVSNPEDLDHSSCLIILPD